MKAVRCSNGHWYDSETYDKCPHCGESLVRTESSASEVKSERTAKKGFSSLFRKNRENEKEQPSTKKDSPITNTNNQKNSQTSAISDDITERFFADIDDEKTVSMFDNSNVANENSEVSEDTSVNAELGSSIKKSTSEPLSDAVQRISAMEDGKTLSYFNAMTTQIDNTSVIGEKPNISEPVVGWLVCIGGAHTGESFQLYVGRNTIGRNDSNKVVLRSDRSVSRENHATIIYEPKKREFYLQTGNTEGLIYLNEHFVDGTQLIKFKDVIEMGSSKFMFIPLCGEDFSWEKYI